MRIVQVVQLLKLQTSCKVEGCNGKVKRKGEYWTTLFLRSIFCAFSFLLHVFSFVGEILMFRETVQEELFLVVDVVVIPAPTYLSLVNVIT